MKLKTFMGMEVEGAYQRYLDSKKAPKQKKKQAKMPVSISNPDSYLILQSRKGDYPDFPVSIHRLSYDTNVEAIAKKLNLSLENTAKEQDGTGYIGNINHEQALTINRELGNFTLPLLYFTDLLYNLMEGIKGNKKIYNANGNQIDARILESMFNEITEVRSPWRSEYLDGKFGDNTITYHKFVNGKFIEVTEELDDCLMEDKAPGIDLEDWLKNPTSQGLPRKNCKAGNLYYWGPVNGRVAGFVADSVGAVLDCFRDPQYSNAVIGVRAARAKI